MFAVLALAFRVRRNAAAHKRYLILATTDLLVAAIARWPFHLVNRNVLRALLIFFFFVAALAIYDLWSTHKIHRVTLGGGILPYRHVAVASATCP